MKNQRPHTSREQALEIAKKCIQEEMPGQKYSIREVMTVNELTFRPPMLFLPENINAYWIAYVETPGPVTCCSSTIILITKKTGEIAYFGSACDEG